MSYGEEMDLRALFGPMLGRWSGAEQQEATAQAPATSTRAMMIFKLDLADTVVLQEYRHVREDGGELAGHGIFQAAGPGELAWWFFDSNAQPPVTARGSWRDGELTLVRAAPDGTAQHRFSVRDDQLHCRITQHPTGIEEPQLFLTARYDRITGH